jgi:hypothetical protein
MQPTIVQPQLVTRSELGSVLDELRRREQLFHHPGALHTRAEYEAMTDASFWETGASGQRYSRADVLDVLERRSRDAASPQPEAHDFHCAEIAADHYLLTYTLRQDDRMTRRMSIWRKSVEGWKILYHQGTLIAAQAADRQC